MIGRCTDSACEAADEMFGEIVAMLERKGALENAIVVVLSDHGEALALPNDTMINNESKIEGLRAPLVVTDFGHGQSVLSPVQYQVLLGFRTFGTRRGLRGQRARPGRRRDGGGHRANAAGPGASCRATRCRPPDSRSRRCCAASRASTRVGSADRVRFTETDLRVLPSTDGGVDEIATAKRNSKFFEVSSDPVG